MSFDSVRIIIKDKRLDLKGSALITGFHGVGFVGYITVKHLISSLNTRLIGFIETRHMPPYVSMLESGRIQTPFEVYICEESEPPLVFVLTEIPLNSRDIHEFAFSLSEWSMRNKFELAFLVGGLDSRLQRDKSDIIRCVATSAYIKKYGCDLRTLDKGYYVVGPLALMLAKYEIADFPAIAILPYASVERPDPRAAAIAIEYIAEKFGLKVDVSRLIEQAEIIEEELREISRKRRERMGEPSLYV